MSYAEHSSTAYSGLSTEKKAEIDALLLEGLQQFYFPPPLPGENFAHSWSFLRKKELFTTNAPSSPSQTVTVVAGVGTMSGGTLATWIAGGVVQFGGSGDFYTVATRDSSTQFTLEDTTVTQSAGTSLAFYDFRQALDDDFGRMEGALTYPFGSGYAPLIEWNEGMIRAAAAAGGRTGRPTHYAVRPRTWPSSGTSSNRMEILFWPFPDASYAIEGVQTIIPGTYTGDTDIPIGGAVHSQAIMASCLAVCEQYAVTQQSRYRDQLWPEALRSAVMQDRNGAPTNLGYNGSGQSARGGRTSRRTGSTVVTYNGVQYP